MSSEAFQELMKTAEFVFKGTVEQVGASNMSAVEASDASAVVRVDQVLHAPPAFTGFEGQSITVLLRDPGSLAEGEEAVFFTRGGPLGETLAVQEIDHQPAGLAPEALSAQADDARASQSDLAMRDRVARANVIVSGRVADVRRPASAEAVGALEAEQEHNPPVSEHDPQWTEAVITVEDLIKGTPSEGETVVVFPASNDVAWADAPKLHTGQEGVFLLHQPAPEAHVGVTLEATTHVALSALDVRPKEDADRVRAVVSDTGGS